MRIDEAILIMENERPHCGEKLTFTEEERYEAYTWAIGALKELSSAQFEERTEERTETHACDLISRQALMKEFSDFVRASNNSDFARTPTWNDAVSLVGSMPSAQPETAKRIVGKSRDGLILWYQCDMCNEPVGAQDNFCCGCGRRLTDG